MSVLLPLPDTPVTHTNRPSGILTSIFLRLFSLAPRTVRNADGFLRFFGVIHTLWFIDDHNGIGFLDEFDRLAARKPVVFLVDDVAFLLFFGPRKVFAKGVNIDNQDLNLVAQGELPELVRFLRVINEVFEFQIVIQHLEVFFGNFQILQHAFPDGHAGNHNDEFLEPVLPAQFENGTEINIRLAGAGLHLNRKVPPLQAINPVDAVPVLNGMNIFSRASLLSVRPLPVPSSV